MSVKNRIYPDLYILRHGQTTWNAQGRFQGRQNSPLTEIGRMDAVRQREILWANGMPAVTIFSSPQERALHTTRVIFGPNISFRMDDRLQEIHFGLWEGLTRDAIRPHLDCSFDSGLWNFRSPGGETFHDIAARVQGFLDDLTGPALLVTHGTTSQVLRGLCLGLTEAELLALPKDHGCVYAILNGRHHVLS